MRNICRSCIFMTTVAILATTVLAFPANDSVPEPTTQLPPRVEERPPMSFDCRGDGKSCILSNVTRGNVTRYDLAEPSVDRSRDGGGVPVDPAPADVAPFIEPDFWCPENFHPLKQGNTFYHLCRPRSCINVSLSEVAGLVALGAQRYGQHPASSQISGIRVLVCNKFSKNFTSCPKIKLSATQFRQIADGQIQNQLDDTVSGIGDYFRRGNEVVVCDPTNGTMDSAAVVATPEWCSPYRVAAAKLQMQANGFAKVSGVNANVLAGNYRTSGAYADVCFPMSPFFGKCTMSTLAADYIHLNPADLSLFTDDTVEVTYELGSYMLAQDHSSATICIEAGKERSKEALIMYGVVAAISSIFLLLALLAHLWIPNLNFHTKALLCLLASMLTMYLALSIRYFLQAGPKESGSGLIFSFAVQYTSGLSSFLWLNVLAFDLWYVFANLNGIMTPGSVQGKKRRFFIKCGYAWGIPLLMCIITLSINASESAQQALNMQLHLGEIGWFHDVKTIFVFFYAPIAIILVENVIFFALTIVNIRKASKGTDILNKRVSRQLLVVFAKLFVVMGICWFFEIISFAFAQKTSDEAWFFTDFVNLSQGVFIFFVYVFKRTTLKIIRAKLGFPMENTSQVTKSTSSSHQESRKTSVASAGAQTRKTPAVELTKVAVSATQNGEEHVDCQTKC